MNNPSRAVISLATASVLFLTSQLALAVSPQQYGAVPNDGVDDTAAIQAVIDNHDVVTLNGQYHISSTLQLRSNLTIESNGNGGLYMMAGNQGFGNLNPTIEFADNAVAMMGQDVDNVRLRNFRITKEFQDQSSVSAIRIRKGRQVEITGLDITGFSNGLVIALDSVEWGFVASNMIHGSYTTSDAQHTAVAIDSSRVIESGEILNSTAVVVSNNYIMDLEVSSQLRGQNRVETDGINIAGPDTNDIWVVDNAISHVGEGIDSYGQRINVRDNVLYENYIFGIKLVHGASNSKIVGNELVRPAKVGIVLAGSNNVQRNTSGNQVTGNYISGVGQSTEIDWRPQFTAGIALERNGGQMGNPIDNLIVENYISDNSQMDYGVLCDVPYSNYISDVELQGQPLQEGLRDCP